MDDLRRPLPRRRRASTTARDDDGVARFDAHSRARARPSHASARSADGRRARWRVGDDAGVSMGKQFDLELRLVSGPSPRGARVRGGRRESGASERPVMVPAAFPRRAIKTPGTVKSRQPRTCVSAAVVAGPPTHAFDVKSASRRS